MIPEKIVLFFGTHTDNVMYNKQNDSIESSVLSEEIIILLKEKEQFCIILCQKVTGS